MGEGGGAAFKLQLQYYFCNSGVSPEHYNTLPKAFENGWMLLQSVVVMW
jgi:hypothetical protein